jgi:Lysine methyltransferase
MVFSAMCTENDHNEDCSFEGSTAQNLFRSVLDIDSDDDDEKYLEYSNDSEASRMKKTATIPRTQHTTSNNISRVDNVSPLTNDKSKIQKNSESHVQRCLHMHVMIEELSVGGSIAHRVWPAAEFLATFILHVNRSCQGKECQGTTVANSEQEEITKKRSISNSNNIEDEIWIENYVTRLFCHQNHCTRDNGVARSGLQFDQQRRQKQELQQKCEENSARTAFRMLQDILNVERRYHNQSQKQEPCKAGFGAWKESSNGNSCNDVGTEKSYVSTQLHRYIHILEIGAGVGLTGLELASQLSKFHDENNSNNNCSENMMTTTKSKQLHLDVAVLLTDLETALPLLQRNIALNFDPKVQRDDTDEEKKKNDPTTNLTSGRTTATISNDTCFEMKILADNIPFLSTICPSTTVQQQLQQPRVHAMKLDWSNVNDCRNALQWFQSIPNKRNSYNDTVADVQEHQHSSSSFSARSQSFPQQPILIIGSDCVYWEVLHEPLRCCLSTLLHNAPVGSICLLAGMRRWKRDTAFYNTIGNRKIKTKKNSTSSNTGSSNSNEPNCTKLECVCLYEHVVPKENNGNQREIMRIYAIYLSPAL